MTMICFNMSISVTDKLMILPPTDPICDRGTGCPLDKWSCGSCDCVDPWQRCDLINQHCIDNSDEQNCPKTSKVFIDNL